MIEKKVSYIDHLKDNSKEYCKQLSMPTNTNIHFNLLLLETTNKFASLGRNTPEQVDNMPDNCYYRLEISVLSI